MVPKFLQLDNQKIAYYESGEKGPAVIFVHGNSLSGLCFKKQLESPIGDKYRLIAIDLPGHGRSDNAVEPEKTYSIPGYAAVVVSLVEKLGINNVVLAGWSLGGHILLEAVDRVSAKGLLIFGTPPVSSIAQFQEACFPLPELVCGFKSELTDEEISAWSARFFSPDTKDVPEFIASDIKRADGKARECMGASAVKGEFKDEMAVLAGLRIPTAVVHGEREQIINEAYLRDLAIPTLWRGDIQIIPGAGHSAHWERPEIFNRLLEEFIPSCFQS